jgi:predicted 3-demethylubiquinone-9 3-methyltransferase (glyoxalase superfamily)
VYNDGMPTTNPCLWFDGRAEEAANFYVSLFPNSHVIQVARTPADYHAGTKGSVLAVHFSLDGVPYLALNGGSMYRFTPAISFQIECADQAEIDRFWSGLVEGGGSHGRCGWLTDRFGVSWQVNGRDMGQYLGGPDAEGAARASVALQAMEKIDLEALRRAYDGSAA